jgi:hypothetical protein
MISDSGGLFPSATNRAIGLLDLSRPGNRGLRSAKDKIINSKVRDGAGDMKEAVDTIEYSTAVWQ